MYPKILMMRAFQSANAEHCLLFKVYVAVELDSGLLRLKYVLVLLVSVVLMCPRDLELLAPSVD